MSSRRLLTLTAMTLVLAFLLSGCVPQIIIPPPDISAEVYARIDGFKAAVESYDVDEEDGILSYFMTTGEPLIITDSGIETKKTYGTLQSELEADAANQSYWRSEYNYALELRLFGAVLSNQTAHAAFVVQQFVVLEEADGLPSRETDRGTITWEWVKKSGVWKIKKMTISFDPIPEIRALGSEFESSDGPVGLGFGVGMDRL